MRRSPMGPGTGYHEGLGFWVLPLRGTRQAWGAAALRGEAVQAEAQALLLGWLKEIGYEQHLHDGADSDKLAAARWANVLDFVDWIARRCGGDAASDREAQSVLQVAQTISIIISLAERGDEQDVVTLSTLHAAKGLEWTHVQLASCNEGLLPFKTDDETLDAAVLASRLEEERRLMYVGITRAQRTLAVSWTKKRKKGREMVAAQPSRFIAEMALSATTAREDPREKLKALRAEFARKAQERAEPPVG